MRYLSGRWIPWVGGVWSGHGFSGTAWRSWRIKVVVTEALPDLFRTVTYLLNANKNHKASQGMSSLPVDLIYLHSIVVLVHLHQCNKQWAILRSKITSTSWFRALYIRIFGRNQNLTLWRGGGGFGRPWSASATFCCSPPKKKYTVWYFLLTIMIMILLPYHLQNSYDWHPTFLRLKSQTSCLPASSTILTSTS